MVTRPGCGLASAGPLGEREGEEVAGRSWQEGEGWPQALERGLAARARPPLDRWELNGPESQEGLPKVTG